VYQSIHINLNCTDSEHADSDDDVVVDKNTEYNTSDTLSDNHNTALNAKLSNLIDSLNRKISSINAFDKKLSDLAVELETVKSNFVQNQQIINDLQKELSTVSKLNLELSQFDSLKSYIDQFLKTEMQRYRGKLTALQHIAVAQSGGFAQ
jgi:uncharacterized phage infection (PIP) family protein YhgE